LQIGLVDFWRCFDERAMVAAGAGQNAASGEKPLEDGERVADTCVPQAQLWFG
tara:strand:- start:173 stop:331 length:159 start_codon:yes stop_codon:yes gene_type:complete